MTGSWQQNSHWPSQFQLERMRETAAEMSGKSREDVRVVLSPYRICPLGAHVDHQGGTVLAMTINRGILLAFTPSGDSQVLLRSGQFDGEVEFSVDEVQYRKGHAKKCNGRNAEDSSDDHKYCGWERYARGALYALQRSGYHLTKGIVGYICGIEGLDSSGLSSSAAVGIAYLLALESANELTISPTENIELDRASCMDLGCPISYSPCRG